MIRAVIFDMDGLLIDSQPLWWAAEAEVMTAVGVPVTEELAARPGRTLIFVRTQLGADRLAGNLQAAGIKAEAIHGGLPQGARRRALEAFTDARSPVLVATDVAARGIHVDDVSLVLHYDPPADHKTYLHRSGRTARAGAAGVVGDLHVAAAARDGGGAAADGALGMGRAGGQGEGEEGGEGGARHGRSPEILRRDHPRLEGEIAPKRGPAL